MTLRCGVERARGFVEQQHARIAQEGLRQGQTLTFATRDTSTLYAEIREIGREFEDGLGALLFSSSLGRLTRTYAIF